MSDSPQYDNSINRKHLKSLERRSATLKQRINNPEYKGNPGPQKRELEAIEWAISVCRVWMLGDELPRKSFPKG